jgi:hypothetical protein
MTNSLTSKNLLLGAAAAISAAAVAIIVKNQEHKEFAPQWEIPHMEEALVVYDSITGGGEVWAHRTGNLVRALWPAIELHARYHRVNVDAELLSKMMQLSEIAKFVSFFSGSPEAALLNAYLDDLPGYRSSQESVESAASYQERDHPHGFLTMQIQSGIVEVHA